MTKRFRFLALALIFAGAVTLGAGNSSAAIIAEFESHSCGGQGNRGAVTGCQLTVEYPSGPQLFEVSVGLGDQGRVFTADETNPAFGAFVALATNGIDNLLRNSTTSFWENGESHSSNASILPESRWLRDASVPNGIDLEGFDIVSIDLVITRARLISPVPDRPFPGLSVRASLRFNDATPIPEPSTSMLFGLGLLGLAARRRSS